MCKGRIANKTYIYIYSWTPYDERFVWIARLNGLARKGDSIKWAKGDPYPSKSRRRSCSPSGASFENGKDDSPKTGCIGSFSFSPLFFFLSYRRLHDNERSKGPVERGQFREIVAGRLRSRASSRNREKLCVTTRYFFLQGVYVYIHISFDVGVPPVSTSTFSNAIYSLVPGEIFLYGIRNALLVLFEELGVMLAE